MKVKSQNFQPMQFLTFTVGTASAAAAQTITQTLGDPASSSPIYDLRVYNNATGVAFVQWGGTAVVATTTTGYPIGPGVDTVIGMGAPCRGVSVIMGTGTGNVYISPGDGA